MNEEFQSANQYDDRTTAAVRSVLVEIGQTLGSYRGKFAVVGGAVPWLLLEESDMRHVGTADIDLSLDAEALAENEQYAGLVEALRGQGYETREELRNFRMVRTIDPKDGGAPIDVVVDFLRPFDAVISKNKPPITTDFATQRAFGADLATHFYKMVAIEGDMPHGGKNTVPIAATSNPSRCRSRNTVRGSSGSPSRRAPINSSVSSASGRWRSGDSILPAIRLTHRRTQQSARCPLP